MKAVIVMMVLLLVCSLSGLVLAHPGDKGLVPAMDNMMDTKTGLYTALIDNPAEDNGGGVDAPQSWDDNMNDDAQEKLTDYFTDVNPGDPPVE